MTSSSKHIRVKVCGMKFPDNIFEVSNLGVDYLGFIFYPKSPRYCQDSGKDILNNINGNSIPVMVSVNMPENELLDTVSEWGFRVVQLHGNESHELCRRLKNHGVEVWKAIQIGNNDFADNFENTKLYEGCVDMFIFDTATTKHGGSGRRFNWNILENYKGTTPFMLSGGISPGDEAEILKLTHSKLVGIDLNSRFEISPGLKDINLLSEFINNLKSNL